MSNVIDLDNRRLGPHILEAIEQFLGDPPDSQFQRGYLAALVTVYEEGLGRGKEDARIMAAKRLLGREAA